MQGVDGNDGNGDDGNGDDGNGDNGDGDDGDGDNDIGDDERQEVSVTHCWLSLALCLTWDAFKMDSTYTWHLARTQLGSFLPPISIM